LLTSIARRPASVMVNRNMLGVRPPAFTISGLGTAIPARTILASSLTSNPCARNGEATQAQARHLDPPPPRLHCPPFHRFIASSASA
jgi:hypothetical protein